MAASNGMSDFEIMGTSPTNVNIPREVTSPVTPKDGVNENSV